jgi:hypothetical protein
MSNNTEARSYRSHVVDELMKKPVPEWPPAVISIMISHVIDAAANQSKGPLTEVNGQLSEMMQRTLSSLPEEARKEILGKDSGAFRLAYLLGQLSFANEFASTSLTHMPDDEFYAVFKDEAFASHLKVLSAGPATVPEVAWSCRTTPEEVSKTFRLWTGYGIVDFRRRFGPKNESEYFLTPAARQMLKLPGS